MAFFVQLLLQGTFMVSFYSAIRGHDNYFALSVIFSSHSSRQKIKQDRSQRPKSAVPWHVTPSRRIIPLDFFTLRSRSSTNRFMGFKTICFVPQYGAISGIKAHPLSCLQWLRLASISFKERTLTQSPGCNPAEWFFP